jgi:PPP family 3-phenylpropionic acid transporter
MIHVRGLHSPLSPAAHGALYYLGFFIAAGVFAPFINVHFAHLGFSGRQIGLLATLFPVMTLVLATPLSALADRRRWRVRILIGGLAGYALILSLIGVPRTFAALVPLMILLSFFGSPMMSIADSLIARMAARHALNYGSMRLWGSIGFATSSVAFGALWQKLGFRLMFPLAGLFFVPVIWFASQLEEGRATEKRGGRPLSELGPWRDSGLVAILVATFLVGVSNAVAMTFESIYMDHLGGSELLIGMLLAISAFSELPTMRYSRNILEYLRGPKTLLLAYGLYGSAYLGYAFTQSPSILLLLAVAKGLGFGLFFSSTVYLITVRTPEEWSATAQALMSAGMFGLAPLITGPLGGTIWDTIGPSFVFVLASLAVGLAALLITFADAREMLA